MRGYRTTMTRALGGLARIEEQSVASRPGIVLVMVPWAVSMAPLQLLSQLGCAHVVRTLAKPASLPPTEIVTYAVVLDSADSWAFVTAATVAPAHARKLSASPRAEASSDG